MQTDNHTATMEDLLFDSFASCRSDEVTNKLGNAPVYMKLLSSRDGALTAIKKNLLPHGRVVDDYEDELRNYFFTIAGLYYKTGFFIGAMIAKEPKCGALLRLIPERHFHTALFGKLLALSNACGTADEKRQGAGHCLHAALKKCGMEYLHEELLCAAIDCGSYVQEACFRAGRRDGMKNSDAFDVAKISLGVFLCEDGW